MASFAYTYMNAYLAYKQLPYWHAMQSEVSNDTFLALPRAELELDGRFTAALLPLLFGNNIPGHTTREPPVGFELATNCFQLYVIANFDKTSLRRATVDR